MNKYLKRVLDFLGVDPSIDNTKEVTEQEVKVEDNIQEPVISFIKCFKANPKRFVFRLDMRRFEYVMIDKLTKEVFVYDTEHSHTINLNNSNFLARVLQVQYIKGLDLSRAELDYIGDNIRPVILSRIDKKKSITEVRKNRANIKNRERLTNIYKQY